MVSSYLINNIYWMLDISNDLDLIQQPIPNDQHLITKIKQKQCPQKPFVPDQSYRH